MDRAGVDTVLRLVEDPWKIKKKLTAMDVDHSSRLLLPKGCVRIHVLHWMGEEMKTRVKSRDGMEVTVLDEDTDDEQQLVFRYQESRSSVLNRGWKKLFVKRRKLAAGHVIGMYWDTVSCKFHFKVLSTVASD